MGRELKGRRIVVTGASSGIGRALAIQLSQKQARIVLAARTEDKLKSLARELPGESLVVPTDITNENQRRNLFDRVTAEWGGFDVLINNAGVASWAHFADSTEPILRQIMDVNFFAPAELIRTAIPILVNGHQPAVVNIASMCGRKGMPAWSEYSASKFALVGLTEALRGELARFEIDILLVLPGLTKSDLPQHFLLSQGKAKINFAGAMPPEQVAAAVVRSLERNKTETWVGSDARWMLWFNKFFPRLTDYLVARKVKQLYSEA